MKKFIISLLLLFTTFNASISLVHAGNVFEDLGKSVTTRIKKPGYDIRNNMLVGDSENSANSPLPGSAEVDNNVNLGVGARNVNFKDNFLGTIQQYLFVLVGIVSIGMFIYTGFRLFMARGDEKEYSQAWKAFAYTVVGLAAIPLSFVLVKIALGFTF